MEDTNAPEIALWRARFSNGPNRLTLAEGEGTGHHHVLQAKATVGRSWTAACLLTRAHPGSSFMSRVA
jgi:hypothetical protein